MPTTQPTFITVREFKEMPASQQKFITVREFVAALDGSVNKNTVYAALRRKEIPSVRIGRRWLIPEDALTQMLWWPLNRADASPIPHQPEKS